MVRTSFLSLVILGGIVLSPGCGQKQALVATAAPGVSQETSLKVCGPEGQRAFLAQLACPGEDPVGQATRAGSLGPVVDGHMVDHFQVSCPDGSSHEIFLDLYHCEDADEVQAVGLLGVLPPPPAPEIITWQPGPDGIPLEVVAGLPDEGVLLEVTSVGDEPRRELRYTPEVGQKETVRMRMLMAMEMTIGGQGAGRMALPAMVLDMDMEVLEVADGEILYSAAVSRASVDRDEGAADFPPEVLADIEAGLTPLVGMSGTARVTDRGEALEASFQLPPEAPADLAQQVSSFSDSAENMAAPVPAEPVGVGATWSTYSKLDSNGFKIVQRADYVLAELGEDQITLDVTFTQQPLEANPQMDSLPPGTEVEMVRFVSTGTGQSVLHLNRLVPVASLATVSMDFAFAILGQGERVEAEMAMDMTMQLSGED